MMITLDGQKTEKVRSLYGRKPDPMAPSSIPFRRTIDPINPSPTYLVTQVKMKSEHLRGRAQPQYYLLPKIDEVKEIVDRLVGQLLEVCKKVPEVRQITRKFEFGLWVGFEDEIEDEMDGMITKMRLDHSTVNLFDQIPTSTGNLIIYKTPADERFWCSVSTQTKEDLQVESMAWEHWEVGSTMNVLINDQNS